ncbi:MAG TPA: hypothetical protein VGR76_17215 [Candidatus Angelobacter sp.]|nr:hypothetical protein [Candidatus Angelobacter sp.]
MPKLDAFTLAGVSCVSLLFNPDRPLSMCHVGMLTELGAAGVGVGDGPLFEAGDGEGEGGGGGDVVFALTPPQPAKVRTAAAAAMVIAALRR